MRVLLLTLVLSLLPGCGSFAPPQPTLYERLGSQAGIERLVDDLLWEIGGNPALRPLFADTDIQRFRDKLVEQFCEITGGPCHYSGDNMHEAHRHLDITPAQFNGLVEDLLAAMDRQGLATAEQNALLERLVPFWPEIVRG